MTPEEVLAEYDKTVPDKGPVTCPVCNKLGGLHRHCEWAYIRRVMEGKRS